MQRQIKLKNWLQTVYPERDFDLTFAAADADFRRYFRATFSDGSSVVCMDAPPDKMSVAPYLKVQKLFDMVNVPQVLHADTDLGFVVLNDLGNTTFLTAMLQEQGETAHKALLLEAIGELVELQKASREGVLPEYDRETMLREINLFPEWFVAKELGRELTFKQRQLWQQTVDTLLPPLLAQPKVYVHRDFIVRNLMLTRGRPGVLDFQDALYGPISYDLVSLLRDAFIEWEEEFVLDLVIRYWEKARAAGLPVPEAFDEFYRWFEWMGVQRHLKVAGIFARLYYRDGKDKYRPEVRNLMLTRGRPGVLDFQDALYGPISYDLVSLLRDAFIEWEEEFVLDLVIRYWEKARAAGLPVPEAFDEFYRWFEWMGVQRHLKVAGIFARLYYRDGKDKYRPEIPRFLNYLRRVSRRYAELAPLYALLVELVGDEELETGFTF